MYLLNRLFVACLSLLLMVSCNSDQVSEPTVQTPATLTSAERAFLEARLDRVVDVLRSNQRDSTDGLLLTYALYLRGDDAESQGLFRQVMANPQFEHRHLFYALGFLLTGELDKALKNLDQERKRAPKQFFAQMLYVETLILVGQFQDAETELTHLMKQHPEENIIRHTLGHLYTAQNMWNKAIAAYEAARELSGENPDLDEGIAEAMLELGEFDQAQRVINRCKVSFPAHVEILYQEIRLMSEQSDGQSEKLMSLFNQYKTRSLRHDKIAKLDVIIRNMVNTTR